MPKIVDHDVQRAALSDACFEVFADEGYAAASMRRLAKAAGVSTGTLYHYFPDKRAIFTHLFEQITKRDEQDLRAQMKVDATLEERMLLVIRWTDENQAHLQKVLGVVTDIHRHDQSIDGRRQVAVAVQRYRSALAHVLDLDSPQLVRLIFSMMIGTLIHAQLDPQSAEDGGLQAQLIAVLPFVAAAT